MDYDTYVRSGRMVYDELARTVAAILEAAVRKTPGMPLQQVQSRAKGSDSLKKKIDKAGGIPANEVEIFAKDLAACRLLFYTNSGVNQFKQSGLVTDNFEVDWYRTKLHHPTPGTDSADRLFRSINYVVRLKPDRAALPEYSHLAGLWCEVQVQTSLDHVWSEMEHDMLYKRPALSGFGAKQMEAIEARMKAIMRDHLVPAGYEFQKVVSDFNRLAAGKELFDSNALKALVASEDLNELHDLLDRFKNYVIPHYDDLPAEQRDIRDAIRTAARNARKLPETPITTLFGDLPGHTVTQVVSLCGDVLDRLKYLSEDAVIATLEAQMELYLASTTDSERRRIIASVGKLAENNLSVWNAAGPVVQDLLVKYLSNLPEPRLRESRPIALEVLQQVVQPEIRGVSSTFDSVVLQHAVPSATDTLANMRAGALDLLKKLFVEAPDDKERRKILSIFERAESFPHRGNYSDDLALVIMTNAAETAEFLASVLEKQSFEMLQAIEYHLLWLYRRKGVLNEKLQSNQDMVRQQERLLAAIAAARRQTSENREFEVYKTLVGFEVVFETDWERNLTPSEQQTYRDANVRKLVAEVDPDNAGQWFQTLTRCAETRSDDLATFPSFMLFLRELAQTKPKIALSYLPQLTPRRSTFLAVILLGLEGGAGRAEVPPLLDKWITEGRFLGPIAIYLGMSSHFQPDFLSRTLRGAIEDDDTNVALYCVAAASTLAKPGSPVLKEQVFLPAIAFLSRHAITRWVEEVRFRTGNGLFENLTDEEASLILSALVSRPKIDYSAEHVLLALMPKHAGKVIRFFGRRLPFEPDGLGDRYEAIPYQLHEMHKALQAHAADIVTVALSWYQEDSELFTYRGGRFIHAAFPQMSAGLESALATLVQSRCPERLQFVVDVLQNYNGDPGTHAIYKAIVDVLGAEDPIVRQIDVSLDMTGVVHGEFGLVEAYKAKKQEMEQWLTDPRPNVQTFARQHLLSLERQIANEQGRSEEAYELRKLEYGQ